MTHLIDNTFKIIRLAYKKAKFDLAAQYAKVSLWSSFYQTMIDLRPRCYVRSFVEMDSLVQTQKISKGILPDGIKAWQPFWPCDRDAGTKLLFT